MRPGEVVLADAPAPEPRQGRTEVVTVRNEGRFTAYLTSHFPVARASAALRFERDGLEGARPLLPAGGSVAIEPGEAIELEVTWD